MIKIKVIESNSTGTFEYHLTEYLQGTGVEKLVDIKYSTCEKGGYVIHTAIVITKN